jgi:hypothetical protein
LIEDSQGVSCLVQNPMTLEMIASGSDQGGDLHLWKFDSESWQADDLQVEGSLKRQRTGVKTVQPFASLKNTNGIATLKWTTNDSIVCGGTDHQLKVFDVQK